MHMAGRLRLVAASVIEWRVRSLEENDVRTVLERSLSRALDPPVVGKGWHATLLVVVLHILIARFLEVGPVQVVEVPVVVVAEAQDNVVQLLIGLFDLAVNGEQQLAAGLG